jgi:hypothetical protein
MNDASNKDRLRKILSNSSPDHRPAGDSGRSLDPYTTQPIRTPKPNPEQPAPTILPAYSKPSSHVTKPTSFSDARLSLQELREKMARLSEEFALGQINRMQFEAVYKHYQEQLLQIEGALYTMPGSDAWQGLLTQGMTGRLKERHAAQVLSYAIYDNASSLPLATVGSFDIDASLLVPMLSSFRSATAEMFGAGLRSTEIEGGRWLCFVPGPHTTLIVLFSIEPARLQLTLIEDLHRDFEVANAPAFAAGQGREAAESFTRIWALDTFSSA